MNISYKKNKSNSMYFIESNGIRITTQICNSLGISLNEYINIIKSCGGKFSPKWGWFLPNEDCAIKCAIVLNLINN